MASDLWAYTGSDTVLSPVSQQAIKHGLLTNKRVTEQTTQHMNQNTIILFQENAFENVISKMAVSLFRFQCVPSSHDKFLSTPGNPFAYSGIYIMRPFCYLCGNCSFRLIQLISMYWRAFAVGSRHISVRFYVCETTRCASAALR